MHMGTPCSYTSPRGHYITNPKNAREIHQNYHKFALFDPPYIGTLMTPATPQFKTMNLKQTLWNLPQNDGLVSLSLPQIIYSESLKLPRPWNVSSTRSLRLYVRPRYASCKLGNPRLKKTSEKQGQNDFIQKTWGDTNKYNTYILDFVVVAWTL